MDTGSLVQPGRQLEFFETLEELAGVLEVPDQPSTSAGYADIYRGFWTDPQGERVEVAIKELRTLIPKGRQTEQEALKWKADTRLKREVVVWSQTTHPNLHPMLGYRSRPRPRLISPWCRHGNLTEYLEANSGLTRCDKLRLTFQTACGLEHLHSRTPPICHADIKPENVLINDWHRPALSDFGLSRVLQDLGAPSGFTTSETVKGTVRYMASELFAGQKPNLESDVYAFGGLILTVMSGKAPFGGLLHHVILRRVMQDQPPIPMDHPNLPANDPVWELMRRCWSNDPTARPTMQEVLRELLGQIIHEESNSGSKLNPPSFTDNGAVERDLNIASALKQGESLPLPYPNIVSSRYSLSSVRVAKVGRDQMPGESLLATRRALKSVQLNSKVIPVIGKYIGVVAGVGLNLVEIVEAMNTSENLSNSLEIKPWRLANLLRDLEERLRQHQGGVIFACIKDIPKELEFAQMKIKELYFSELFRNEFSLFDHASQKRCRETFRKVLEEIQLLVTLDTKCLVTEFENTQIQEEHRRLLNRLGDGKYGAHGNVIDDVVCLPGTRVEILERVDNWIRDTTTPDRVLWIRGMAGRGKSTIASTVAHNWQSRASCAIFHFRRGHNTLNARIVCALARQLGGSLIPKVRRAVLESIQENEDIADQRLDAQFETLLVVPLSKLTHQPHTVIIVVDALDECENPKDVVDFVKLIDQHSSSFPTNIKFLLTCRPEARLLRTLQPRNWHVEDLDISVSAVNDVARFIKQGCTAIREDHGLPNEWPSSSDARALVEMSQGLFQWAQTVITYIGNGSPVNRLRDLLKRPSTWNGLDDLYHQILSKALDNVKLDPRRQELLYAILGTLAVAPCPVSLEVIAALYGDNSIFEGFDQESIIEYLRHDILVDLNSLLLIPTSPAESIRLMHTSIRDLLVNKQRCQERLYYVDISQHHQRLASLCLGIMIRRLKENICSLSDLSKANSEVRDVIEREVSTAIRYCCRAWSIHLTEGAQWQRLDTESPRGQRADFETFSREKLLYWLEVMSLIGATTEAIVIAKRVNLWLSRCPREIPELKPLASLWNDAQRFITAFLEPISFGALHIYASALAHCPQRTGLWEYYGRHAKIRTLCGVQPLTWSANLWTRSVSAEVCTVAFSPNGAVLASGTYGGQVQLWDVQTGSPLGHPLTGHSGSALSIAFSPDGKVLTCRSEDGTILSWNAQTGLPLGQPIISHNDWIRSPAVSPDGTVLASGSLDGTIRLCDPQTGTPLGQPLTGHSNWVLPVAFSSDGKVLVSGSDDRTIRLWDVQTRLPLGQPLIGHSDWVRSVAFSPDGEVLASGSFDGTIRLWDVQTWTHLGQPPTDHNNHIFPLAFSPRSQDLDSGHSDETNPSSDAQIETHLGQPMTHRSHCIRSIALSPSGDILASGSEDGTILLRDTQAGSSLGQPLTGHSNRVCSVTFSPDGMILASGSWDGTIRLWDVRTTSPLGQPLTGRDRVRSVTFSPDGNVLASGSNDHTIRLWDIRTGSPLGQPLIGHSGLVSHVTFSPDGNVLASGSEDGTIRLWDTQTGTHLGPPLSCTRSTVTSVAFSPDGQFLVSALGRGIIQFWDAQTRMPLGQSRIGRNDTVSFVLVSHGPWEPQRLTYHIPSIQDRWVKLSTFRLF